MIDQLPYTLTKGVTATREGLAFRDEGLFSFIAEIGSEEEFFQAEKVYAGMFDDPIMRWPDAAERLRYREGEPWSSIYHGRIVCYSAADNWGENSSMWNLHRLAAILCDDAEAFRMLHWCVTELEGDNR